MEDNEYIDQEAIARQQIQSQEALNAPVIHQQQAQIQAALVEQTNPNKILYDIEMKLKGYRRNHEGDYEKFIEPLMNEKGISKTLLLLSSIVNQNTILSHLEEEEISRLIVRIGEDIVDDLTMNWRAYDIIDKMSLDSVVNIVVIPSFVALKRAWKQNEKNWLNKTVIESISNAPRVGGIKKPGGVLDRFKL